MRCVKKKLAKKPSHFKYPSLHPFNFEKKKKKERELETPAEKEIFSWPRRRAS